MAPKFPRPVTLNFLFRIYARDRNQTAASTRSEMNLFTLRKMAAGGMHDHLGGGFHRYSVDAFWHVPHFEKMLYDQAQLAVAYLEASKSRAIRYFEGVARDILDYVRARHDRPEGGFFSAEDADSEVPVVAGVDGPRSCERKKARAPSTSGANRKSMRRSARPPNFRLPLRRSNPTATFRRGSDPHAEFTGKNILIELQTIAETAKHFKKERRRKCERSLRQMPRHAARAPRETSAAAPRR